MINPLKTILIATCAGIFSIHASAQQETVQITKSANSKIDVSIGSKPFTSFFYPDTLEKPVLNPVYASNGTVVTRGYPFNPQPRDPTDHPHHIGIWFNFENVNGLDFWNNSFAIPSEKKKLYGWIKTDKASVINAQDGKKGSITYHANWTNHKNEILLEENTTLEFSGTPHQRIIDRVTTLKAKVPVLFKDAKDGMLGIRAAHQLQIPSKEEQTFADDKGNKTTVPPDTIANGNYLTSEGKEGDSVWSTRAVWCKLYGKIGSDSVSISIIDHPSNTNYPTFWHARGYGLFAANPLGESIFTNKRSEKNLKLNKGQSVTFRFRILVNDGPNTISPAELNEMAKQYGSSK